MAATMTVPGSTGLATDSSGNDWAEVQPAHRQRRPRWRDLRLLLGIALVLLSTVAGARLMAGADHTTEIWAAGQALVPGATVGGDDLVRRQVRLVGGENPYLTGEAPVGYVVTRHVAAGELLPASAVATFDEVAPDVRLVTLTLPRQELPPGLAAGDLVDVWVSSKEPGSARSAVLLAERVPIAAVPDASGAFGAAGSEQSVVLAVARGSASGAEFTELLSRLVSAAREGDTVLAQVPGSAW